MPDSKLADYVAKTRAYMRTPEGRRTRSTCMRAMGWPYERAVAAAVMHATGLVIYERIAEVTDAVVIAELAPSGVAA
jgi:hypothetical protein